MSKAVKDIGLGAAEANSYTNWEFNQILGNRKYLKATQFYENGAAVETRDVPTRYSNAIRENKN